MYNEDIFLKSFLKKVVCLGISSFKLLSKYSQLPFFPRNNFELLDTCRVNSRYLAAVSSPWETNGNRDTPEEVVLGFLFR